MSRHSGYVVLAIALLLLLSAPMFAASQNAVVYGTVYDAQGNPMAGVTVTLDNAAFNFSRTTTTGSDGSYNFAEVPPADNYRITALRGGNKLDVRGGISVNVGDERVILPPLKEQAAVAVAPTPAPGAAPKPGKAAPVTAAGEGPTITTETVATNISGVITRDQLQSLPLYNRNFLYLGLITPNVHDVQAGSALTGASFSVAGNRPEMNAFLLDGTDNVASLTNQAVPFQVNDSIQEFRVISSAAAAEYGRGGGGTVNVVTRRASNNFHGSAYGYFGNDALNGESPLSVYTNSGFAQAAAFAGPTTATALPVAPGVPASPADYNSYVATAAANGYCTDSIALTGPAPAGSVPCRFGGNGFNHVFDPATVLAANNSKNLPFDSKQFGASMGGPIIKDKLFVFGSFEGTQIDNPNPIFERVPSTFDRTYFPTGNSPLGGANNFASGLGPADPNFVMAQKILALFPTPNVIGVPNALEFFRGEAPNYTNVYNGLARLDWVQSAKSTWTGRFVIQHLDQLAGDSLPESTAYPGNGEFRDALNMNLDISFNHTISSNLLNSVYGGFTQFNLDETAQDHNFDATSLGLPTTAMPAIFLSGLNAMYSGGAPGVPSAHDSWIDAFEFPGVVPMFPTLNGLFPMARIGAPLTAPSSRTDTTWFIGDNLSWTRGKHNLKFGFEYRRLTNELSDGAFTRGFVTSSDIGEFTNDASACNGCGTAYLRPSFDFAERQHSDYVGTFHHQGIALFAQDTWRFHPRFTLNLGLRYEYFGVPNEENNQVWNYDPAANGLVQQGFPSQVLDPYGNVCNGSTGPTYTNANVPSGSLLLQFLGGTLSAGAPNVWNCQTSGSDRIARSNYMNFAPRIGLAWDVAGDGKTVLRVGAGIYYDQSAANTITSLMFNRPTPFNATNPTMTYGQLMFGSSTVCTALINLQCQFGNTTLNPASAGFASGDQAASSPFAVLARDVNNSYTPYVRQLTVTLQHQLNNNIVIEGGYVGAAGQRLPAVFNSGFNNQWFCTNSNNLFSNSVFAPLCDNFSQFPVFTMTNLAKSNYHSAMVRMRVMGWHGLRANLTYTWSRSMDNQSTPLYPTLPITGFNASNQAFFSIFNAAVPGCTLPGEISVLLGFFGFPVPAGGLCQGGAGGLTGLSNLGQSLAVTTTGAGAVATTPYLLPQDPNNWTRNDWGRSDFDTQHRIVVDYTYDVPSLQKKYGWSKWLDYWQLSGIVIAQTGQPFTIFAGPAFGELTQRVNLSGPVHVTSNPDSGIVSTGISLASAPCNAAAATVPFPGGSPFISVDSNNQALLFSGLAGQACIGNSARNSFVGPTYVNVNFAVQKGFPIMGEGKWLYLRGEFYNLFNRANLYNPDSQFSTDGLTQNPRFGQYLSAHDPRQIQLSLRFNW